MAFSSALFIPLVATVMVAQGQQFINLQLAPTSTFQAPVEGTLPLSCAFTITDIVMESTLMLGWNKLTSNGRVSITDASNTTVYRSQRGVTYFVTTLFLRDLEFSDAGAYECTGQAILELESVRESTASPIFNISIHVPRTASFQLRLIGVDNCGVWNANDTFRTVKSQTLTDILIRNALPNVCLTPDQLCSFSLTNQSFTCAGSPTSNGVTFTADIELRLKDENSTQEASELVDMIDKWKNTGSQVVNLASQNLLVDPSCDIRSPSLCNDDIIEDGGPRVDVIPAVIGGIVAVLVLICITVIALAVVIATVRKNSSTTMMDEMLNQRTQSEDRGRPTILELSKNDAYSSSSNYTQNIAYHQSHRHSQNLDDPSVAYYYSTNSAVGNYSGSHSPTQVGSSNNEDDTHSSIGNYTQNIAYKHTSGGADDLEDAYCYSTNTAYGANAQSPYEVNVAYGVHLADSVVEGDGEMEYYYSTTDRQDPDPSSGSIEVHEVCRHS